MGGFSGWSSRFGGLLSMLAVLWVLAVAPAAHASGDIGCAPSWKLEHHALTECDNGAVLGPGNDTRANLLLLLFDRHGARPDLKPASPDVGEEWTDFRERFFPALPPPSGDFADGEGSRCRSDTEGVRAFEAAVRAAAGVGADEQAALVAARRGLKPTCMGASPGAAAVAGAAARARSPAGRAFARYLVGTDAFYAGRYDEAAAAFAALRTAPSPWLQDTAAYMRARVEVNRLQVGAFDQFGALLGPEHVNAGVADAAEASLRGYLRERPGGAYAGSARGLLRRVYWLSGRTDRLAAEYALLLQQPPRARAVGDAELAEEIDDKLLGKLQPQQTTDPVLLAVADLRSMRTPDKPADKDCCGAPITLAQLEAQRPAFASAPALFDHLLAVHALYVERSPAKVLRLIPDETHARGRGYLWFSRQVLRGMALEAVGDRNARGFWVELAPGATLALERPTVELAIGLHDERAGEVARVFEPGSPVRDVAVRRILLADVADAGLLRREATAADAPVHEREIALFTLLYKELTRGRFADFVADAARAPKDAPRPDSLALTDDARPPLGVFVHPAVSADYACPPITATARALAADPKAPRPRLCLAEWVRLSGLDGYELDTPPPRDELGGSRPLFPGPVYARLTTYRALIAAPATPPDDRGYALFRAVNCYAPSGINQCGGVDADKAERKGWYTRLKAEHPNTRWAQELRYWW